MPTNLYGPNDNFDLTSSHVLPALIRKFHDAKVEGRREVTIWGTGTPRREFLHVDDLADACLFLMRHYDGGDARQRRHRRGPHDPRAGRAGARDRPSRRPSSCFDTSKPDGTPRKLLDVSRLHALGWRHRIGLREGIASSYEWFLRHYTALRETGRVAASEEARL